MPAISIRKAKRFESGEMLVISGNRGQSLIIEVTPEGFHHLNPKNAKGDRLPDKFYRGGDIQTPSLSFPEDTLIAVRRP